MPYEIHQLPYTDLHSINLDWIFKKLGDLESPATLNDLLKLSYDAGDAGSTVYATLPSNLTITQTSGAESYIQIPTTAAGYFHRGVTKHAGEDYTVDSDGVFHILKFGLYEITTRITVSEEATAHRYFRIIRNLGTSEQANIFTLASLGDVDYTCQEILEPGDTISIAASNRGATYNIVGSGQTQLKIGKLI